MKPRMKSTFANRVHAGSLWECKLEYSFIDICKSDVKWVYIKPGDLTLVLGKEWSSRVIDGNKKQLVSCFSQEQSIYYHPSLEDFYYHYLAL